MSTTRRKGLLAIAGGLFSFALLASPAAAQQTLRGRVADGADNPVAGAVILLHAVSDESGRELDRDTADADGRFELSYAFEQGPLYFVATRVDGEIYMAEPFREPPSDDIVLRAGAGATPLDIGPVGESPSDLATSTRPTRDSDGGAIWVVIIAAAVLGVVAWVVRRGRRRAPRARELLLEIARLDEERAAAPAATESGYRSRRDELRVRLIEALELDPHADRH